MASGSKVGTSGTKKHGLASYKMKTTYAALSRRSARSAF